MPLPRRAPCDCIAAMTRSATFCSSLPRRIPGELHRKKYTERSVQFCRMCCEQVDSFSQYGKPYCALTIFPYSSAAKAIYITIIGSLGRTIDRFLWCEPHRFLCVLSLRSVGYSDEYPYWKVFSKLRTNDESLDDGTVQTEDSRAEEKQNQNY